ncbi:MAG: hypothetical protein ACOX5G_11895 [Kiritimatiellia bacterium]|jgi:hypothetical protein
MRTHSPRRDWMLLPAILPVLLLSAATVWFGALNQDEGWYLYAARQVARGFRPYRDFFFTQGPLLPWVYGLLSPLWSPFGIAGGRLFTAVLGLLSSLLAARLASGAFPRDGGNRAPFAAFAAGASAFLMLALSPYHVYFTTIPKTYALAACCLAGGLMALDAALRRDRLSAAALGGFLLACAAAARLSLGAALPVAGVWLAVVGWRARGAGSRTRPWLWLAYGIGGIAGLLLFFCQPVAQSFEAFRFANSFHTGRAAGGLVFAAGSLARLARGHLALAALAVAAATLLCGAPRNERRAAFASAGGGGPALWLACFAAIFAVHLSSPFPYDDYQTPVMPVFAAAVSVLFWKLLPRAVPGAERDGRALPAALGALWLWACIAAAASPICQDWVLLRQDRFWSVTKKTSDLALLREVGARIRKETPPDVPLLTQDAYIAVEADRLLPSGFEMGPFGYFPALSDEDAAALHVLNRAGLETLLLESPSRLAVFSGYGLAIGAPSMAELPIEEQRELRALLETRYRPVATIPDFGQGHTTLGIWELRQDLPAPPAAAPSEL